MTSIDFSVPMSKNLFLEIIRSLQHSESERSNILHIVHDAMKPPLEVKIKIYQKIVITHICYNKIDHFYRGG